jgi:hypothetical protein
MNPFPIIFIKILCANVFFEINPAEISTPDQTQEKDTVWFRNFAMITPRKQIIKIDALVQNTYIDPQSLYNDANIEKTYSGLNSLGAIKFVNIGFEQVDTGLLDCHISIIRERPFRFPPKWKLLTPTDTGVVQQI